MGSVSIPRLYRKRSGTYFLRVLVDAASSSSPNGRKRSELRISLRTKEPGIARALAAWINARLEQITTMSNRRDYLDSLGIRTWTIDFKNGSASAEGPDDSERLSKILAEHPRVLDIMQGRFGAPAAASAEVSPAHPVPQVPPPGMPPNPMRMSQALAEYQRGKLVDDSHKARTAKDKQRLLRRFVAHVAAANPALGPDPHVHEIGTHHITAFLNAQGAGDQVTEGAKKFGRSLRAATPAPATLQGQLSGLCTFFQYAHGELNATTSNPGAGLEERRKGLQSAVSRKRQHYKAFTSEQLVKVFKPAAYLGFNRDADYFWAPLLALHLGARLGELVTLSLADIQQQPETGIWFLTIQPDNAKNDSSARSVPISDALERLGFVSYIRHLRRIGAKHLFPHRDMTTQTALDQPGKNCTRQFGAYLKSLGLREGDDSANLVFHSFRHSVIQMLQDGGTPPAESMLLVGHAAQDHALKTGQLSADAARSVHMTVYGSHAGEKRINVDNPLARLKSHLDRCIDLPLDYLRLRRAAYLVCHHTTKATNGKFSSGWSTLKPKHHSQQMGRLK